LATLSFGDLLSLALGAIAAIIAHLASRKPRPPDDSI
jgi:hypothetical protein